MVGFPDVALYPHCLLLTVLLPSVTFNVVPLAFTVMLWFPVGAIDVEVVPTNIVLVVVVVLHDPPLVVKVRVTEPASVEPEV